ncbi:MAG: hypothetical protein ABIW79_04800, partial [Gemmatimonas sp.]
LPVLVTCGVAIAYGLGTLLQQAAERMRSSRVVSGVALALVALLVPAAALLDGWRAQDASRRFFTEDYARNVLRQLPPNAIYFTVGDNDTFPILYMQAVEGIRPDVQLVNVSLANAPEYIAGLRRVDPAFPLSMTREQQRAAVRGPWTDTVVTLPVSGTSTQLAMRADSLVPGEIVLHPKPQYGPNMIPSEIVLLDLIRTNAWKRPLTFAITASEGLGWLQPFARLDGLFWRVVPERDPPTDAELLRGNLAGNQYRGYADASVVIGDVSRTIGGTYFIAFDALLAAEGRHGINGQRCRAEKSSFQAAVPLRRVVVSPEAIETFMSRCPN